ncbi:MAG: tRNA (adenosine(37)-N6)-threonylcarbamoyltransferase complex ATPase subunit type 1 TsaE [Leptospirales bacterium]|nr:tRNA (adenosine(37)-N6)-threonylcarbamoyltransferase complex ATPase subunit type 1 TsaE [Leptospirales bacterium]
MSHPAQSALHIRSADQAQEAARWILQSAQERQSRLLLFSGQLGAGKTTIIRQLAALLGIQDNVNSPSFNLLNVYDAAGLRLFHYDLYRLGSPAELEQLDFLERWQNRNSSNEWHCVEWPERAGRVWQGGSGMLWINIQTGVLEEERRLSIFDAPPSLEGHFV